MSDTIVAERRFTDYKFKRTYYEVTCLRTLYVVPVRDPIDPWSNWHICDEEPTCREDFLYGLDRIIAIVEDHDSFEDGYALNQALERAKILCMSSETSRSSGGYVAYEAFA